MTTVHEFLTTAEAAAIMRTPVGTLRYWRYLGVGPKSFKLGRHVLYPATDLRAWLDQQIQAS